MVNKDAITRFHVPNRTKSLRVPDAIPDRLAISFQLFERIRFRIRFRQEISGLGLVLSPPLT